MLKSSGFAVKSQYGGGRSPLFRGSKKAKCKTKVCKILNLEKAVHYREGAKFAKKSRINKSSVITLWVDQFLWHQVDFICVLSIFAVQMPLSVKWNAALEE
jgi:hypothetical protein